MLADVTAKQLDVAQCSTSTMMGQKMIATMCNALKNNNPRLDIKKFVSAVVEAEKKYANPDVPF